MIAETPMKTILVVDDDSDIRESLALLLRAPGVALEFAENGQEALERIAVAAPDLILLDLSMPIMDGRRFVESLDARAGSRPPLVVMTAAAEAESHAAALRADAVLVKPYSLASLITTVTKLLEGR
jgi:CheY-like chemotaxis protein